MKYLHSILNRNPEFNYERPDYTEGNEEMFYIHHYCPHTFNAGDHFVIQSIRKYFKKFIPNTVFIPKAVADNRGWGKPIGLRGNNINISNKQADAVILGGSDQYNNWSPRIKSSEVKNLEKPLYFIGLGVSSADIGADPYLKKSSFKKDILASNLKTRMSSVRDDTTNDFLKSLGFNDALVTGCPALFLFEKEISYNEQSNKVVITFPYPLIRHRKKIDKFEILINSIDIVLKELKAMGKDVIIACHDDRDVPVAQKLYSGEKIFFSNYVEDFYKLYGDAQLVIGSRLHANILASGMGVPTINLNLDLRGDGFSKTFGLSDWNVNYNDPDINDKIVTRAKAILSGDLSGVEVFKTKISHYKEIYLKFMKDLTDDIKSFKK